MSLIAKCFLLTFIWGVGLVVVVVKLMDPITYAKLLCRIFHLLRPTGVFYGHSNRVLTIIYKTLCKNHGTPSRDLVRRREARGNSSSLRSFTDNEAYDNFMGILANGINDSNNQDRRRYMMYIEDLAYEELSELEKRIGSHKLGSSEKTMLDELKARTLIECSAPKDVNEETGICSICQDEYESQKKVSILKCGHEYHTDCIRQWLMEKNFCPICKRDQPYA